MAPGDSIIPCGSPQCIAEAVKEALQEQSKQTMNFMQTLITTNFDNLKGTIEELRTTIEKQGDDLYPRMRDAEANIKVIKDRQVGEVNCTQRMAEIKKTSFTEEERKKIMSAVEWVGDQKSFSNTIKSGVLILIILAVIGWLLYIFDIHGKSGGQEHSVMKQEQVTK